MEGISNVLASIVTNPWVYVGAAVACFALSYRDQRASTEFLRANKVDRHQAAELMCLLEASFAIVFLAFAGILIKLS